MTVEKYPRGEDISSCYDRLSAAVADNPSKLCTLAEDEIQNIVRGKDLELRKVTNEIKKLRIDSLAAARSAQSMTFTQTQDTPKQFQQSAVLETGTASTCSEEKRRVFYKHPRSVNGRRKDSHKPKTKSSVLKKHERKVTTGLKEPDEKKKNHIQFKKSENIVALAKQKDRTLPSSANVIPSNALVEIPESCPLLNNITNCCHTLQCELLTCQEPTLSSETQNELTHAIQKFQQTVSKKLIDTLTEEWNLEIPEMEEQIAEMNKFSDTIVCHKAHWEKLNIKLSEERPERNLELMRHVEKHRGVLKKHKQFADDYSIALAQLEVSRKKISVIDSTTFAEMKSMKRPPKVLSDLITAVCLLFGMKTPSWDQATSFICGKTVRKKLLYFEPKKLDPKARSFAMRFIAKNENSFDTGRVRIVSKKAVALVEWVNGLNGMLEVTAKLNRFPNGDQILLQIESALDELRKVEDVVEREENVEKRWANVLGQLEYDINVLKSCHEVLETVKSRRTKLVGNLKSCVKMPKIPDTNLPASYMKPYWQTCEKIRSRLPEFSEADFKFTFAMLKRYYVLLMQLFKTYASFEGKNGQGIAGMSSLIWGIMCKSMKLPKLCQDEAQYCVYEIFNLSSVQSVEATTSMPSKGSQWGKKKSDIDISGVWTCKGSKSGAWNLQLKSKNIITGFIGNEKFAHIKGSLEDDGEIRLKVSYQSDSDKAGMTAKCKASIEDAVLNVKYVLSNKEQGAWILQRTATKVRVQSTGISTLQLDSFLEAIIRLSRNIWGNLTPWEALETIVETHVIGSALSSWNVNPKDNDIIQKYINERSVKKLLASLFSAFSQPRCDKKKGRLMVYSKWEELVGKINRFASGPLFERASFRTMQFSFFTSKELFPQDGPLDELTWGEFKEAIVRLAYIMVLPKKSKRRTPRIKSGKPQLLEQCKTLVLWLGVVKVHLS